jgi:hypothetical protein
VSANPNGGGEIHKAKATTVAVSNAYLKEHEELVRAGGSWSNSLSVSPTCLVSLVSLVRFSSRTTLSLRHSRVLY